MVSIEEMMPEQTSVHVFPESSAILRSAIIIRVSK